MEYGVKCLKMNKLQIEWEMLSYALRTKKRRLRITRKPPGNTQQYNLKEKTKKSQEQRSIPFRTNPPIPYLYIKPCQSIRCAPVRLCIVNSQERTPSLSSYEKLYASGTARINRSFSGNVLTIKWLTCDSRLSKIE